MINQGLFDILQKETSFLDKKEFTKSSLVALSHGIEDVIINEKISVELFVTFQDFSFFKVEKERYLQLDKICHKIFIFAQNIERTDIKGFKNTAFIEIDENDMLRKEWDLLIYHPDHSIVLSTHEEDFREFDDDLYRKFNGFLSFSPAAIKESFEFFQLKLKENAIDFKSYFHNEILNSNLKYSSPREKNLNTFLNRSIDEIEEMNYRLKKKNIELHQSLEKNKKLTLDMVRRLCYAAEFRDEETAAHLIRLSYIATTIYSELEENNEKILNMSYASLMHDIGKVGIPDNILLKPGKLTDEEYEVIKEHPLIGAKILGDSEEPLMQMSRNIALYHHEWWNGNGYPEGLAREQIPLAARVVAVADVFDALTSKRVYKDAFSVDKSMEIIKEKIDIQFDRNVVKILEDKLPQLVDFKEKFEAEIKNSSEKEVIELYFDNLNYKFSF